MSMKVEVRKAELRDIPALVVMIYCFHEEAGEALTPEQERYIQAFITHELVTGGIIALVATTHKRRKEKTIGMGMFSIYSHPFKGEHAWGTYLYVDPNYRGMTIAKQIIEAGERFAKERRIKMGCIETTKPKLFERLGYKQTTVLMEKPL